MKRFSALFLTVIFLALSIFGTGCLFVEEEWDPININIVLCEGTYENLYYMSAADRFEEHAENNTYADMYEGVNVEVVLCDSSEFELKYQGFAGFDIYVTTEKFGHYVRDWANEGYVMGIDDVFKEGSDVVDNNSISVEEKLKPSSLSAYMSDYYEYCAVPNTSEIVGLSYDANAFDQYGYYFANDVSDAEVFYSEITEQNYYFVNATREKNVLATNKSAGVDGIFGTEDDGLPRTIYELVALCEYIKSQDKYPFIASGKDLYKADYLIQALTYSLMGYEEARACMDLEGKLQVVTGYTNEPLFSGFDAELGQIYKPRFETVELTETSGYYASWALAKYYAEAFMELSVKMDWWADLSYRSTANSLEAIYDFVFSGYDQTKQEVLMLCESSAWYKNLEEEGYLDYYNKLYNNRFDNERRIRWMSMPTLFDGKEEYASSRTRQTYQQVNPTYIVVANQVGKSLAKSEACRDFLKFLCTEQECNFYTITTGLRKDFGYQFNLLDLYEYSEYFASLEHEVYNADIVYLASEISTFKKTPFYFEGGKRDSRYFYQERIVGEDELTGEIVKVVYTTAFQYYRDFREPTTKVCFKNKMYNKDNWSTVYGGYSEPTVYINANGKAVTFNG